MTVRTVSRVTEIVEFTTTASNERSVVQHATVLDLELVADTLAQQMCAEHSLAYEGLLDYDACAAAGASQGTQATLLLAFLMEASRLPVLTGLPGGKGSYYTSTVLLHWDLETGEALALCLWATLLSPAYFCRPPPCGSHGQPQRTGAKRLSDTGIMHNAMIYCAGTAPLKQKYRQFGHMTAASQSRRSAGIIPCSLLCRLPAP
ncbi:hypothetical protein HPB52_024325 [Rhipicephalus sanguineus]|uniref:Uncharacterized protein n=1 Tax=Rhipicephalus sanguineus TaxID=34632 RepID=A0A9D4P9G7_RHISA|nr:hypothetical protein HPB52_024325 [Rhipicephalus sanguineus]